MDWTELLAIFVVIILPLFILCFVIVCILRIIKSTKKSNINYDYAKDLGRIEALSIEEAKIESEKILCQVKCIYRKEKVNDSIFMIISLMPNELKKIWDMYELISIEDGTQIGDKYLCPMIIDEDYYENKIINNPDKHKLYKIGIDVAIADYFIDASANSEVIYRANYDEFGIEEDSKSIYHWILTRYMETPSGKVWVKSLSKS